MVAITGLTLALFAVVGQCLPSWKLQQSPILEDPVLDESSAPRAPNTTKVAIIGSGITGAAAAFRLFEGFRLRFDQNVVLTIFERNPIVGGRITQAFAFNDPTQPVDTCAATFAGQDTCISQSATMVGLTATPLLVTNQGGTGVWDGEKFVGFVEADDIRSPQRWSLFKKLKWLQVYGDAPFELDRKVAEVRQRFTQLLPPPILQPGQPGQPGQGNMPAKRNLSEEVEKAQLTNAVKNTLCQFDDGREYIDCFKPKEGAFVREIVNAGARERYFEDIGDLKALESLFGYEDENPVAIQGGNLRLVDRLIRLSGAQVRLNRVVEKLERLDDGMIRLNSFTIGGPGKVPEVAEDFDTVIIAAPLKLSNITFEPEPRPLASFAQEYDDSFVTHFTTPSRLNGTFFNRKIGMPQNVLTSPLNGKDGPSPPFFSLTFIRTIQRAANTRQQSLYKLVSREMISDDEIGQYLDNDIGSPTDPLISWIDRQPLPKSVPRAKSDQKLLEDFEIMPGVIYAGAGEQIVATAEFGCRMGVNAAQMLLV